MCDFLNICISFPQYYISSEVCYVHEVCQPAVTHTTALYSKCARTHNELGPQALLLLPTLPWGKSWGGKLVPRELDAWRNISCGENALNSKVRARDTVLSHAGLVSQIALLLFETLHVNLWNNTSRMGPNTLFLEYYAVD